MVRETEKPLWIESEVHTKLKTQSARKQMSMKDFVAHLLEKYDDAE